MGLATAQLLASRGANISLADINEEGLKVAIESLPNSSKHIYSVVDVRESKSVDVWIQSTLEKFGQLDGAVNMAGIITTATPITELSNQDWEFNFDVNARGVFYCLRAQLRVMSAGGSIVSISLRSK
jgi:arginine metabolism regulation protein II